MATNTNDKIVLDCECVGGGKLNEMKQVKRLVREMQNPVVLAIVQKLPTMTYRNNPDPDKTDPPDIETGFTYKFGGRITHQCVDERDVSRLLQRTRSKRKLFIVEPNHVQPDIAPDPSVDETTPHPNDPFTGGGNVRIPKPANEIDAAAEIALIEQITGIGNKTASSFVDAGYTFEFFVDADPTDGALIGIVAEKSTVAPSLVAKAIEGAKEVETDAGNEGDDDDEND